jgi:hypothetical protein
MLEKYLTRHASPQGFDFTAVNLKIKKMQKSSAQCGLEVLFLALVSQAFLPSKKA